MSGNNTSNKFENSGLTATKSENVDAPIINEFPICLECEFIEYQDDEYGCGVVGKVVNVTADESVMNGDNVDIELVSAIAFDPFTHGYYKVTKRVGNAFEDGFKYAWDHLIEQYPLGRSIEKCNNCNYAALCDSCPANRMAETGDWFGIPEYACKQAKYLHQRLKDMHMI